MLRTTVEIPLSREKMEVLKIEYRDIEKLQNEIKAGNLKINQIYQALEEYKWLSWLKPVDDFINTHVLSDEFLFNVLPLLNKYYERTMDTEGKSLKYLMFLDPDKLECPRPTYAAYNIDLYHLFSIIEMRIAGIEEGLVCSSKPVIEIYNTDESRKISFDYLFTRRENILSDVRTLSLIWDELLPCYGDRKEFTQIALSEWLVGKMRSYEFCALMRCMIDQKG